MGNELIYVSDTNNDYFPINVILTYFKIHISKSFPAPDCNPTVELNWFGDNPRRYSKSETDNVLLAFIVMAVSSVSGLLGRSFSHL